MSDKMNYVIDGRTLRVNDFQVDFINNVRNVVVYDGIYIVLTDYSSETHQQDWTLNNVFGVDSVGKLIWQIQNPSEIYTNIHGKPGHDVFIDIGTRPNGSIFTSTYNGQIYLIDHETGKYMYHYKVIGSMLKAKEFEIDFKRDISKVVFYDGIYVVCLNPSDPNSDSVYDIIPEPPDNIYGVSISGEILWSIQLPNDVSSNVNMSAVGPFTNIGQNANGRFVAHSLNAMYLFEYKTGKITEAGRLW